MPIDDALAAMEREAGEFRPEVMVTLGSGLGEVAGAADIYQEIPYGRLPGFVDPTVVGHPGKILLGHWGGRRVVVFQGRLHFYEGRPWEQITLPVRLAIRMGATTGIFTNMSGAINARLRPGSLVVIDDHMNFMGSNPLVGVTANDPEQMFPDMGQAYSARLRVLMDRAAGVLGESVAHGVYVGVSGPNYETPAEVRAYGLLGADVVGMSTVGEVIVARQAGMECCGISCVANMAAGITGRPIHHEEVLQTARSASLRLGRLIDSFLRIL